MMDIIEDGPLPAAPGSPGMAPGGIMPDHQPGIPTGPGPDTIPGSPPPGGVIDSGKPGAGSGGVHPIPNPAGIPGAGHGPGEDKGDIAPNSDQVLDDLKKGTR